MNVIDNKLIAEIEVEEEYSSVARLIQLGRKKSYVTIDDILSFFPEAERDVDQLEEAFAALLSAGIPYIDDESDIDITEGDGLVIEDGSVSEESIDKGRAAIEDNYLANIDTDDMIGLYLKEVGRVPLLTAKEEVQLAMRIERGRISREELATRDVDSHYERKTLRLYIEDGWAGREHLITANSRLVISVAKKYMGRGVPFQDLIQEGNIGLIRAAKKFDYRASLFIWGIR
jgi:RNA polymerase primary sigma factor